MITMGGYGLPSKTIREMIVGSVDVIIQAARLRDGSRRITHITEVVGLEGDVIVTQDLFVYEITGEDQHGDVAGPPPLHRHRAAALLGPRPLLRSRARAGRSPRRGGVAAMDQMLLIILVAALGFAIVVGVGLRVRRRRSGPGARGQARPGDHRRPGPRTPGAPAPAAANTPEARRKQLAQEPAGPGAPAEEGAADPDQPAQAGGPRASTVPQFWMAGGGVRLVVVAGDLPVAYQPAGRARAWRGGRRSALPHWVLGFLAGRRTKKFTAAFSDAMDIIVRGIKSGLPVHDCLKIIGRETPEPLAGEFRRLVENIGMGMTLDQALEKTHEHMPTAEVRFFSIVMNIQQKTGGNLAEALNNLSTVLRSRKLMREKIKALSSEATASAMIIGSPAAGRGRC